MPNQLVNKILRCIRETDRNSALILTPAYVWLVSGLRTRSNVVIIIRKRVLRTVFWCPDPGYLKRKHPELTLIWKTVCAS